MSRVADRLAELGLALPPVVAPLAAYLPAVRSGSHVYTAGQLPLRDGQLPATGKVGAGVEPELAARLARDCALNALAAVATVAELDDVVRIVFVRGYVASAPGFSGQSAVVDGASTVLQQIFGEAGRHARSAVGVAELPRGAPVELELVAEVG